LKPLRKIEIQQQRNESNQNRQRMKKFRIKKEQRLRNIVEDEITLTKTTASNQRRKKTSKIIKEDK